MFPRKRAILIGADQYESLRPLGFCANDVDAVAHAFRNSLQFRKEDVLEFRLNGAYRPERTEVLGKMGSFLNQGLDPDELLVFYFSGHGMIDEDEHKDYLLPIDASPHDLVGTGIEVQHIIKQLAKTRCKNIVMFIDACREAVGGAKGLSIGQHSQEALRRDGIVTFFSCDPKEKSYEIEALEHGSFTHCILQAIAKGECQTVDDIDKFLRENVPPLNAIHQKPPQLPFTIIQPREKGQLAIFYRQITSAAPGAVGKYDETFDRLGELLVAGTVTDRAFCAAIEFLEKQNELATLSELDIRKLRYVESLSTGKYTSKAFEVAWSAAMRRDSLAPPKTM